MIDYSSKELPSSSMYLTMNDRITKVNKNFKQTWKVALKGLGCLNRAAERSDNFSSAVWREKLLSHGPENDWSGHTWTHNRRSLCRIFWSRVAWKIFPRRLPARQIAEAFKNSVTPWPTISPPWTEVLNLTIAIENDVPRIFLTSRIPCDVKWGID